jgi:hypothetical protein
MNRIFATGQGTPVPDGTVVHSLLQTALRGPETGGWDDGLSIALGVIPPHTVSKIHLHPLVTQVTLVLHGALRVVMKDTAQESPYSLDLVAEQGTIARPGTLLQYVNQGGAECRVLYIVSPAFVYEVDANGSVLYNDALVLDDDWKELAAAGWAALQPHNLDDIRAARCTAVKRLQRTSCSLGTVVG